MTIKLSELFARARQVNRETRAEGEAGKLGNLRAGNSGIVSPDGDVAGSCLRKAHLRALSIETEEHTEDKLLMFDLGFGSEEIVYNKLKSALPEGHMILREEEIPIEWTTSNGTRVTGRPDLVICSTTNGHTPVLGIELKSVHSMWTARDVLFKGKPKLSNLIQAAHYMWRLSVQAGSDVPYKLVYTSYSNLGQGMTATDSWVASQFPRMNQPGSERIEYNDKGQVKHIKQFELIYDVRFNEKGIVEYRKETPSGQESSSKWTPTIITRSGIEQFFERAADIGRNEDLGPRPTPVDLHGDKAGYTDCNYCPLKETCNRHEKAGYTKWLDEVNKLASSLKKK